MLTTLPAPHERAVQTQRVHDVSARDLALLANGFTLASPDDELVQRLFAIARAGIVRT